MLQVIIPRKAPIIDKKPKYPLEYVISEELTRFKAPMRKPVTISTLKDLSIDPTRKPVRTIV